MSKLKYYRTGQVDVFPLKNPSPVVKVGNELFLFRRMGSYARLTTHSPNGKRLVKIVLDKRGKRGRTVVCQRLDKSIFETPLEDVQFLELSVEGIILDKLGDLEYIMRIYPDISSILYRVRSENITIRYRERVTTQYCNGFYNLDLPANFNILLGYVEF